MVRRHRPRPRPSRHGRRRRGDQGHRRDPAAGGRRRAARRRPGSPAARAAGRRARRRALRRRARRRRPRRRPHRGRRVALAAVRGRAMAAACALEPTGMSAVLGGEPRRGARPLDELGLDPANRNGARPDRRRRRPRTRWPRSPQTRRRGPGSSRCRWPAPSTPVHGAGRGAHCAPHAAEVTAADPTRPAAVQRRRHRRSPTARRRCVSAGRPGHAPGAVGPLHGAPSRSWASPA